MNASFRRLGALFAVVFGGTATPLTAETVNLRPLQTWPEKAPLDVDAYRGSIVVLDFFAYWCVPCRQVTPALETDLAAYYAAKGGNPAGVAVHVMPINIESAQPKRTDRFIRATGAQHVHYDPEAVLFTQIGQNTGLPFLAVVDWRGAEPVIVYRHAGYEGAEALRAVIDQIGGGA